MPREFTMEDFSVLHENFFETMIFLHALVKDRLMSDPSNQKKISYVKYFPPVSENLYDILNSVKNRKNHHHCFSRCYFVNWLCNFSNDVTYTISLLVKSICDHKLSLKIS